MLIIDSPPAFARALDSPIDTALKRFLTARRDQQLDDALFIIVQPGDNLEAIEQAAGFPIATNLADGAVFPDPEFVPSWEWMQPHEGWHEIVYILSDDGRGAVLLVPRGDDIDPTLLAIVRTFGPDDANTGCVDAAVHADDEPRA